MGIVNLDIPNFNISISIELTIFRASKIKLFDLKLKILNLV